MPATDFSNRVFCNTATAGTGNVTIGTVAASNMLTPTEAGMVDGETYGYSIEEGSDMEDGFGVLGGGGTTITRVVKQSKISGVVSTATMNLAGGAKIRIVPLADDLRQMLRAMNVSNHHLLGAL